MPSGVKRTHKDFVELMKERPFGNDIVFLSEYITEKSTIKCQCIKCGYIWETTPKRLLSGIGCKACANIDIVPGFNDLATVDPDLAAEWDYDNNNGLLPTAIGAGSRKKASWVCSEGHRWEAVIYDRHTRKTKCPYCMGKLPIIGKTDLKTVRPEIAAEWDYKKNGSLKPESFTEKSSKRVWWICEYGHEWQTPIYSRSNGVGCPQCAKELQTSFPEQAVLYYVERAAFKAFGQHKINNYNIDIYIPTNNTIIEYDGEKWHRGKVAKDNKKNQYLSLKGYRIIRIREEGLPSTENAINLFYSPNAGGNRNLDLVIQECLGLLGHISSPDEVNTVRDYDVIIKRLISRRKENSLERIHPELLVYWDYESNTPLLPDMVSHGSGTVVAWKCPTCGYEFKRSVRSMVRYKSCPVCVGKSGVVKRGVNDLCTVAPELAKEWDQDKNDLKPFEVSYNNSINTVWWKCSCGHSWKARIIDRYNGTGCPYCSNKKVLAGFNDLLSKRPDIAAYWDYKGNEFGPESILYSSKKAVLWRCDKGHLYKKSPYRMIAGEGCPYCASRKIQSDFNSLAVKNPELANEWHPEKNENLTPYDVMPNSTKKVWWRGSCGHEWEATIANRNNRKSGCPFCAGKRTLVGFNDLATLRPDIASEWNYEKNIDLSPSDFTSGSSKKVWWRCDKGHEWQATIDKRCAGRGCPECRGRRRV